MILVPGTNTAGEVKDLENSKLMTGLLLLKYLQINSYNLIYKWWRNNFCAPFFCFPILHFYNLSNVSASFIFAISAIPPPSPPPHTQGPNSHILLTGWGGSPRNFLGSEILAKRNILGL